MADYCKHLASILRKAQGVIDAETNQPIDVGEECAALRQECDALRAQLAARDAEVGRLREALEAVDAWDINWADGLDENVERIKDMVRAALKGEDAT